MIGGMENVLSVVCKGSLDEAGQIALKQNYKSLLVTQQSSACAFAKSAAKGSGQGHHTSCGAWAVWAVPSRCPDVLDSSSRQQR